MVPSSLFSEGGNLGKWHVASGLVIILAVNPKIPQEFGYFIDSLVLWVSGINLGFKYP